MSWPVFLATPTAQGAVELRRYSRAGAPCPVTGFAHEATTPQAPIPLPPGAGNGASREGADLADADAWPRDCVCGYAFMPTDAYQYNVRRLYAADPGLGVADFVLRAAPIGALWYCPWLTEHRARPTDEQLASPAYTGLLSRFYWQDAWPARAPLTLHCPGNWDWILDQVASNGPGWQVRGAVPLLTATPSIGAPRYHGFLTNGLLTDDLEGRHYA